MYDLKISVNLQEINKQALDKPNGVSLRVSIINPKKKRLFFEILFSSNHKITINISIRFKSGKNLKNLNNQHGIFENSVKKINNE